MAGRHGKARKTSPPKKRRGVPAKGVSKVAPEGSPAVKGRSPRSGGGKRAAPNATPKIEFVGTLDPAANAHLKDYKPPTDRPIRIYSDGIYDMFHYGHARALEQVKKLFPNVYLLVGVCNDELTKSKKGRTVMNENERAESLRHCRWVDEVVENAPWVLDDEFLTKHRIDFVAHDDIPYQSEDCDDVYKFVKDRGQFIATQRTAGISTSDLITRIVRDYDAYVRRNLQRGATPRELNLSLLKQGEIKMQQLKGRLQQRLREEEANVKSNWENTREELASMLQQWESKSQELIRDFSDLFDVRRIFRTIGRTPGRRTGEDDRLVGSTGISGFLDVVSATETTRKRGKGSTTSFRRKILAALTGGLS